MSNLIAAVAATALRTRDAERRAVSLHMAKTLAVIALLRYAHCQQCNLSRANVSRNLLSVVLGCGQLLLS